MTSGKVVLKKFISNRITNGHPYVYQNEIENESDNLMPGSIVDVFTFSRQYLGRGFYNPNSKIRIRLLTRKNEKIDRRFVESVFHRALNIRRKYLSDTSVCRLFNSDADGISGFILDKFCNTAVIQFNTFGAENLKDMIIDIVDSIPDIDNIVEKSDTSSRVKEGLKPVYKVIKGNVGDRIAFSYRGIDFFHDFSDNDGISFSIEQRDNSVIAAELCKNMERETDTKERILDVFCNNGNFGMRMLEKHNCKITFIDNSERAIEECKRLVSLNGFNEQNYINDNAFDFLRDETARGKKYFAVILDPPSFTNARSAKGNAMRGYKEVNLRGMKLLKDGGYLVTSSCSKAVSREDFEMMIYSASTDLGVDLCLVHRGGQSADFPIITNIFETEFLKFYIYRLRRR